MHSHSEPQTAETDSRRPRRHFSIALIGVLATAASSVGIMGALVTTDRYIVEEAIVVTEDQYVTAMSTIVEGTIEGDLTVFSGSVTISGTVTGSVRVFAGGNVTITETGVIGGSLDGAAFNLRISGTVGSDVFFSAGSVVVESGGSVGRDVMAFGGTSRVNGDVGRDLRGRTFRTTVDGTIGGDVDIATQSLGIGATAVIDGDVVYRSPSDASIAPEAVIGGTITKLPTQANFVYSLILTIANVVGFLGFVAAGLVALALLRGIGSRAVGAVLTHPIQSLLVGIVSVIVLPLTIALLAITLVGIPLAAVLVALAIVAFVVGAVPAVSALGNLILVRRGGLFGAFLVGAVVWRLGIQFVPYVGAALYVIGLVWGIGGWVLGAIAARRGDPTPAALLPSSVVDRTETLAWEPPLAPGSSALAAAGSATTVLIDLEAVDEAGIAESDEIAVSEPEVDRAADPSIERDTAPTEVAVTFGDEPTPDSDETEGVDGIASASERFAALRDELSSTGTVQPSSSDTDRDDDPDGSDDESWGLPKR